MAIFDKLNPLKKKDDFPEFGESLGARTSSVPGPSFDENPIQQPDSLMSTTRSPEPVNDSQLNSIQSTLNLLVSKVESMKSSLDGLSQRVSSLEKNQNTAPENKIQAQQPQFNPYQSNQQQTPQPAQQPTSATTTHSNEDEGWHF